MEAGKKQAELTKNMVLTGLFVSLGLIIPYLTGHAFGMQGTVFLPMHIPVLLCGMLCGWQYGALCGLATPALSCMLTAMPPAWPMLPIMACELTVYGLTAGLCHKRFKLPVLVSLLAAMLAGRAAYGLAFAALNAFAAAPIRAASVWVAVVTGLPGIAIQLVLVPVIVRAVERRGKAAATGAQPVAIAQGAAGQAAAAAAHGPAQNAAGVAAAPPAPGQTLAPSPALAQAVGDIKAGRASCVVVQNGAIVHRDEGPGVSPLLRLYDAPEGRKTLQGALVADKIIGKAAAMILVLGGARQVYGEVMSASARTYLEGRGIETGFGRCVDVISNRAGNGICPIENAVLDIDDPEAGLVAIRAVIRVLMGEAAGD